MGGDGPDLFLVWGFISHVELAREHPDIGAMLRRFAAFARVINFDKRGMGLSDPVPRPPTLEERTEDMLAVLDAAGSDRAYVLGVSEGVPAGLLFAATYPDRVKGLVLYGGMARSTWSEDHPWAASADVLRAANREFIAPHWGSGDILETFAPSVADDPRARAWQARMERNAAPPGVVRQLFELFLEIDVREIVPTVDAPALVLHREGDRAVNVRASRWLAEHLPHAELLELPGCDHQPWIGDVDAIQERVEHFVTGSAPRARYGRSLRSVLFTDVSRSTEVAAELGDERWRDLLRAHEALVREELARHGGVEVKSMGDGFLATFDGPARAIRCAADVIARSRGLGLEVRPASTPASARCRVGM